MILMIPDAISRKHRGVLSRSFREKTIFRSTFLLFADSPSSMQLVSKKREKQIVQSI